MSFLISKLNKTNPYLKVGEYEKPGLLILHTLSMKRLLPTALSPITITLSTSSICRFCVIIFSGIVSLLPNIVLASDSPLFEYIAFLYDSIASQEYERLIISPAKLLSLTNNLVTASRIRPLSPCFSLWLTSSMSFKSFSSSNFSCSFREGTFKTICGLNIYLLEMRNLKPIHPRKLLLGTFLQFSRIIWNAFGFRVRAGVHFQSFALDEWVFTFLYSSSLSA
jgi:hypothetical protein